MTKSFESLCDQALKHLSQIALQTGAESNVYAVCGEMWRRRVEDARISLGYGDLGNALLILDHAVAGLALAPTILARNEMAVHDLELLLQSV